MSRHLVAVYGTLRRGGHNHRLLESSEQVGEDFVYGKLYDMGGAFPYLVLDENEEFLSFVEVYSVDEATLQKLDYLEGYVGTGDNNHYCRSIVKTAKGDLVNVYHVPDWKVCHLEEIESGNWFVK